MKAAVSWGHSDAANNSAKCEESQQPKTGATIGYVQTGDAP
jgi:hypothetical protein